MVFQRSEKKIFISLVDVPRSYIDSDMIEKLSIIFRRRIVVQFESLSLDKFFDPIRDQYHSTEILRYFIFNHSISGGDKKCIVVRKDLFIPILTFVFGEAHLNGNYCIVSTNRLCERFYDRTPNVEIFKERLLKEIVHELGHTFGLTHCLNDLCVMHNSFTIEDTDRKSIYPCEDCFEKLDEVL